MGGYLKRFANEWEAITYSAVALRQKTCMNLFFYRVRLYVRPMMFAYLSVFRLVTGLLRL